MPKLSPYLRRTGMRKGLFGGSRPWLALGLLTWGYQRFRKLATRQPELVAREELRPGDRLIISHGKETVEVDEQRQSRR